MNFKAFFLGGKSKMLHKYKAYEEKGTLPVRHTMTAVIQCLFFFNEQTQLFLPTMSMLQSKF